MVWLQSIPPQLRALDRQPQFQGQAREGCEDEAGALSRGHGLPSWQKWQRPQAIISG